ncbi:CDGSH iron-sulfur domain-containing protein [Arthrobacter sp. B3I4]|uniref:CDGSH iron-sulfur domain-containing protein n=1 Tax=Arthrobacter sp. B3I4 TaxID=3042267 RepID=UPI00278332D1|nr:CDGSH iron-sulfur domain-containing protein [Arthrobacter sp. B3I4]MDQ0754243.1 CDGSH-type Zn-finger protein [Arthrobacter sp. B3I4]
MSDTPQQPPNASLVVCPDGPILVRGDFDVVTPAGDPVPRQRQTIALCRCGASAIKPYCDGTHKLINFRTEAPAAQGRSQRRVGTAEQPADVPEAAEPASG